MVNKAIINEHIRDNILDFVNVLYILGVEQSRYKDTPSFK